MRNKSGLFQYLHHCDFRPVITTWNKAIDAGYFSTWPGLTSKLVCKHLPNSMATPKGHLRQDHQNVRSTKPPTDPITTPDEPCVRTHKVFSQTIKFTGKIATDKTGRFPVTTSRSSKYIMVLYDHGSNTILTKPMKSRSDHKLIRAYSALHSNMTERSLFPTFQMLDNELPESFKSFMHKEGVTFQPVLPHLHHRNTTEHAIQTFRYHFFRRP